MSVKPFLPLHLRKLKRGPAVILPKDAGMIITHCNLNKHSYVVEIGGGSGFLTLQIAGVVRKVVVYEKNPEFCRIIKDNLSLFGFKNVVVKNEEIAGRIKERHADCIIFDIPNAAEILPDVVCSLEEHGNVCAHALSVEQMKAFYLAAESMFMDTIAFHTIALPYAVNEKRVRPEHISMVFSSFLVFGLGKI